MDAQCLFERLTAEGYTLRADGSGLLVEPASTLTLETRRLIRSHKAELLGLARSPARKTEMEIRGHLKRLLPGEDHADFPEALALALRDPAAALEAFRSTKGAA